MFVDPVLDGLWRTVEVPGNLGDGAVMMKHLGFFVAWHGRVGCSEVCWSYARGQPDFTVKFLSAPTPNHHLFDCICLWVKRAIIPICYGGRPTTVAVFEKGDDIRIGLFSVEKSG